MPTALGSLKLTDLVLLDGEGSGLTDTDDLPEGATNLYYTDARARAAISVQANVGLTYAAGVVGLTQDLRSSASPTFAGVTLGSLAGVLKASSGAVSGSATTSDLTEGSNLYYTDARVTAYLGALAGTDDATTFLRGDKAWSNTLSGGLNVGSASGAGTGQVRISDAYYVGNTSAMSSPGAGALRLGDAGGVWTDVTIVSAGGARLTATSAGVAVFEGFNVGSATGAATGQVRASASVLAVQPAARVTHNATQGAGSGSVTTLAWDTEDFDTDTIHDNSTNNSRLTCKTAGKYLVVGNMDWGNLTGGNRRQTVFLKNGATYFAQVENPPPASASQFLQQQCVAVVNLAVNDYVDMRVYQDSGGSYTVPATTNGVPYFSMIYQGT